MLAPCPAAPGPALPPDSPWLSESSPPPVGVGRAPLSCPQAPGRFSPPRPLLQITSCPVSVTAMPLIAFNSGSDPVRNVTAVIKDGNLRLRGQETPTRTHADGGAVAAATRAAEPWAARRGTRRWKCPSISQAEASNLPREEQDCVSQAACCLRAALLGALRAALLGALQPPRRPPGTSVCLSLCLGLCRVCAGVD